jgi:N-acyl-D-aspartate/D-glutamate deacylase
MIDLVVRGGRVIDGSGAAAVPADVAIRDGVIAEVAPHIETGSTAATETIDATGCVVTPGFVDVHTHYDGQVTWDEVLEPSTPHGVTTVVMGNCGVGFAPVHPGQEGWLIELMEGVEDIPGAALHEGMSWGWESFPEYVDQLSRRRWSIDVAVQIPHGPVRAYVMGRRGATSQPATVDDLDSMSRLVREAAEAGALGFTTSRTLGHASLDGTPVPGTFANDDELFALAKALRDGGGRVFEVAGAGIAPNDDPEIAAKEMDWIGALALDTGLTTTFIALQDFQEPNRWRTAMAAAATWRDRGAKVVPLVAGRPFGILFGWDVRHPFQLRPSYEALAHLPLPERLAELRRPAIRERILAERAQGDDQRLMMSATAITRMLPACYPLGLDPDYEPAPDLMLGRRAHATGRSVEEIAYDALTAEDGCGMVLFPVFNYVEANHDVLHEQMMDPAAVLGLDDGGAHCATICDASIPTYVLTHWVRDRTRGPRLALEDAVRRLTSQPAELYGFTDRGRIAPGLRADLNVIDLDALHLRAPVAVRDLPAGGTRILQGVDGYRATIVRGAVTRRDGVDTGARPGRLMRG